MRHIALVSYFFIIIFLLFFCVSNGIFLNETDGITHYNYYKTSGCTKDYYPNGVCIVSSFFGDLSKEQFWAVWFIILAVVPLVLYYFNRNEWILPAFFIFAGFWFSFQSMQVYAQILAMIGFIILVYSKPSWIKLGAILILLGFDFSNLFVVHNQFKYILGISFFIELYFLIEIRGYLFLFGFSSTVIDIANKIRFNVYNKLPSPDTLVYFLLYYGYTFLFEYMFIIFTLPGLRELLKSKDQRPVLYLAVIIGGAIMFWVYESFNVWRVTRVLLFFPLIILPYFIIWLQKQSKNKQICFWIVGILYFICNLIFYMTKTIL